MGIVAKGPGFELHEINNEILLSKDGLKAHRPYRLRQPRFDYPAGTVCYLCTKCDYGCADDDERVTGEPHVSMTLKADGDYEFFTVPLKDLEEVETGA